MTPLDIRIRRALPEDAPAVTAMLVDAAKWVEQLDGTTMWVDNELDMAGIESDVDAGLFYLAQCGEHVAGTVKFQVRDQLFWPDLDTDDSAFVHRLAVRRQYAGAGVSMALLRWAAAHARSLGKRYLRLDCDADRPRLRHLYERFGFRFHSYRQVGSYDVARYEIEVGD